MFESYGDILLRLLLFYAGAAGFVRSFGEVTEGGHDGAAAALTGEDEAYVLHTAVKGAGGLAQVVALG